MRYTVETSARNFDYWLGAKDTVERILDLDTKIQDEIFEFIEMNVDLWNDPTDYDINNFVWMELQNKWKEYKGWDFYEYDSKEEAEEAENPCSDYYSPFVVKVQLDRTRSIEVGTFDEYSDAESFADDHQPTCLEESECDIFVYNKDGEVVYETYMPEYEEPEYKTEE